MQGITFFKILKDRNPNEKNEPDNTGYFFVKQGKNASKHIA